MLWAVVSFIIIGLGMVALSIPMILGKVPPNAWYGFRVSLTSDNPDLWYPANAYAGRLLCIAGLVTAGAGLLMAFVPGITFDGYALAVSAIMLVAVLVVLVLSQRYVKKLAKERDG